MIRAQGHHCINANSSVGNEEIATLPMAHILLRNVEVGGSSMEKYAGVTSRYAGSGDVEVEGLVNLSNYGLMGAYCSALMGDLERQSQP
jgi:hypothetical protein